MTLATPHVKALVYAEIKKEILRYETMHEEGLKLFDKKEAKHAQLRLELISGAKELDAILVMIAALRGLRAKDLGSAVTHQI